MWTAEFSTVAVCQLPKNFSPSRGSTPAFRENLWCFALLSRPEMEIAHGHSNDSPHSRGPRRALGFLSSVCPRICVCTMLASWHLSFRPRNPIKYTYEGNGKSDGDERSCEIKASPPKDIEKLSFLGRARTSRVSKGESPATYMKT